MSILNFTTSMLGDNGDNDLNSCFRVDYESGKYVLRKERDLTGYFLIGREKQNPQKKKKKILSSVEEKVPDGCWVKLKLFHVSKYEGRPE